MVASVLQDAADAVKEGALSPEAADALITVWQPFVGLEARVGNPPPVLERIQPDLGTRLFIQRLLGGSAFGFVREHVFPIFFGDGANGKSVLASIVQHVLGDFAQTAPASLVIETRNEPHMTQIASLWGVRLAFVHETKRGVRLNVERRSAGFDSRMGSCSARPPRATA